MKEYCYRERGMTCRAPRRLTLEILAGPVGGSPVFGAAEGRRRLVVRVPPWRAFRLSGALHLLVAGALVAVVSLHLPGKVPDEPVISLVSETTPQGSTAAAAPAAPVPQATITPAPNADLPLPPPPAPSPRTPARAPQLAQAARHGLHKKAEKNGAITVTVIRQAEPYADNLAPDYSQEARDAGEQGLVRFTVSVTPVGTVGQLVITKSSGYPGLDASARDAALQWRFRPALRNGVPVSATLHLWIKFETQ